MANEIKKCPEQTFKIILIGDTGTGKSSFIQSYVFDKFIPSYKPTIGVDFLTKTIRFEEDMSINLALWDVAGQERFGGMTRIYYKDAVGCLLLFDLSSYSTFESVRRWKDDLDNKIRLPDGSPLPCVLVGNKCDLERDARITNNDLADLVQNKGFTTYCRTSIKSSENVSEAVNLLVADIVRHKQGAPPNDEEKPDEDSIRIEPDLLTKPKPFKCSTC